MSSSFITELENRGLIFDHTLPLDELHDMFDETKNSVSFYIGFDPTADSLHVGSLQQLIIMDIAKKHGHNPIVLLGGATASIGDPSFKDSMRPIMTTNKISENTGFISTQVNNIIPSVQVVNNLGWTQNMNLLDFLRDFGKHFSVNKMLSSSAVKDRLSREDSGLSFLEFSYSLLQGFDFLKLNERQNVTVQMGGSDQFFNILQGVDLVHKVTGKKVVGITNPLVLKYDDTKMGKTVNGAVWLDKDKTSVFDFFQFWRNIDDIETVELSKRFLGLEVKATDDINQVKKHLALSMVEFVHGISEKELLIEDLSKGTASKKILVNRSDVNNIFDVVMLSGLFSSKGEVRRMIKNKENLVVNDVKIEDENLLNIEPNNSSEFFIQKGKKQKVSIILEGGV